MIRVSWRYENPDPNVCVSVIWVGSDWVRRVLSPQSHGLEGKKLFDIGTGLVWWACSDFLGVGGRHFDKLDDV